MNSCFYPVELCEHGSFVREQKKVSLSLSLTLEEYNRVDRERKQLVSQEEVLNKREREGAHFSNKRNVSYVRFSSCPSLSLSLYKHFLLFHKAFLQEFCLIPSLSLCRLLSLYLCLLHFLPYSISLCLLLALSVSLTNDESCLRALSSNPLQSY